MKTGIAVSIAVVSALLLNYAVFLEKKAVGKLPELKLNLSWGVIRAFATNWPWMSAQIVNITGFALYAVALALAPVSVVEPIIASGVALLAYLAIKHLGEAPRPRDFVAIGMTVSGVILIGISLLHGVPRDVPHYPTFWVFAIVIIAVSIAAPLLMSRRTNQWQAAGLGISCGLLFGIAAVFTRLLMINWGHDWVRTVIFLVACILTYVPAFFILQAGLQRGQATVVAPVYNGLMEFVPILVGMVALNESFPKFANGQTDYLLSALRILAFALILVGTVILAFKAEVVQKKFPEVVAVKATSEPVK
jgi:drug/metabolite transporter (DMT)-like permease